MMKLLAATATLALALAPASAAEDFAYDQLIGNWTVTAVGVEEGNVQALLVDDPADMGAQVSFRNDAIAWTRGTDTRPVDPAIDNCDAIPTLTFIDESYRVTCGAQSWGPGDGALLTPIEADSIQLRWYNGGILTRTRDGATADRGN